MDQDTGNHAKTIDKMFTKYVLIVWKLNIYIIFHMLSFHRFANMLVVDIWSSPHTAVSELSRQFVKICTGVRKLQTNEVAVHVKKNQWSGKGARKVIDNR